MNTKEMIALANRGSVPVRVLAWEMAAARIGFENGVFVPYKPNPLWAMLERECKSGEELYQCAKDAGLLKSNFPSDQ